MCRESRCRRRSRPSLAIPGGWRRLLDERAKLLEAHYAGAIPLDLLKTEQNRIGSELDTIEQRLSATELKYDAVETNLKKALDLVANLHGAYLAANHRTRRLMNQAIFERFLINDDEEVTGTLASPFDLLIQASGRDEATTATKKRPGTPRGPSSGPRGLSKNDVVGERGAYFAEVASATKAELEPL